LGSRKLRPWEWAVVIFLASLVLVSTFVLLEFGTYLGFSFGREFIYPLVFMVLSAFVGFGFWFAGNSAAAGVVSDFISRRALGIVLGASAAVRLAFTYSSSIFPDEYGVIQVLNSRPLENLSNFLLNYQQIAGNYLFIHPPLSLILMDVGYLFVPSVYGPRFVSALFSTLTVLIVYYLIRDLGHPDVAILGAAVYGLVPHTALYLTLALTDGVWIFFGVTSFWLIIRALKRGSYRLSVASGVFLSLALWTKAWLPFFWLLLALVMILLVYTKKSVLRHLIILGGMSGTSLVLFSVWGIINPTAYQHSITAMFAQLLRLFAPAEYNIWTTEPTAGEAGPFSLISVLAGFFPKMSAGTLRIISYTELIAQLPLWIPLVVVVLSLAGLAITVRRNARFGTACVVWITIPFLLMLPYFRDMRYLIVTAPLYALLASLASHAPSSRKLRLSMQSILLASIVISIIIMVPVSHQMCGGVQEAASELRVIGLTDGNVLTNVPAAWLTYYLPHLHVGNLGNDPASLLSLLKQEKVNAVIVLHNERGAWPDVNGSMMEAFKGQFRSYTSGGPSAFSWYELYYQPVYSS